MNVRPFLFAALFGSAQVALAAKESTAVPVVSGPTLQLDRVVVTTTPDYRFLESGWRVGEVPGIRILSHGNAADRRISEQLQLARAAFGLVWKDESLLKQLITVVVTADEAEFLAWAQLLPVAMDRTVRIVNTPGGTVLVVNGANPVAHRTAGRGFVLALLNRTRLPRWFQEGLAQIVNSVEAEGANLRVGKVHQDPRNQISTEALRELSFIAMSPAPATEPTSGPPGTQEYFRNSRGDNMRLLVDGFVTTGHQVQERVHDENIRRAEERVTFAGDTDFLSFIDDGVVMDLDKILDPQAPDSVAWRMNAWGFTHYSLFGEKQRFRDKFLKFVPAVEKNPTRAPVEIFKETFGLSPGKYELNLALYAKQANYDIFDFKLAEPFQPVALVTDSMLEANVLQVKARVYAAQGRTEEARGMLAHGYANPQNRTPAYVRQYVELERAHDAERAARVLEEAARRDALDNGGRILLAEARLARLQREGAKLSPQDLSMVLLPLFKALEQGENSEALFVLIGRAWAASAAAPKSEHLNALRLGLTIHPQSQQLAALLKQLEHS